MKNHELSQVIKHWGHIAPYIKHPENDRQLDELISKLDALLDIVGQNENHELMGLVDVISYFIEEYETERYRHDQEKSTGIDALKFLMESNNLTQSDLPEIGTQGIISEILHGKRHLNLRQITALARRFKVDPSTFIDAQPKQIKKENAEIKIVKNQSGTKPPKPTHQNPKLSASK